MNSKIQVIALFLSMIAYETQATNGVDLSSSFNNFGCLKSNGYSFVITRAMGSLGTFDSTSVGNINNARAAGIAYVDAYMFPCRGKTAVSQADTVVNGLGGANYGMIWIDVEANPSSGCSFSGYSASSNCQFITDIANELTAKGKKVGIYSSYYQWQSIMGSTAACTGLGKYPIWYAHYDYKQTFSDFTPFGGWSKPAIKQHTDNQAICGGNFDINWY